MWSAATTELRRALSVAPIAVSITLVFLSLFAAAAGAAGRSKPANPRALALVGATPAGLLVSWKPAKATAGHRITGYEVYLDGVRTRKTKMTRDHLRSLRCGVVYTVGIRTVDSAGRRSKPATITASTAACRFLAPVSSFDPAAATSTTITASWDSSGARVSGYTLMIDGSPVGTTNETSHTFDGLACGSSYALGVQSFDAAGGRSEVQTVTASTSGCETAPAPGSAAVTAASAETTTTTTAASADARVAESSPTSNAGSSNYIRVDGGSDSDVQSFVQFSVQGLTGAVLAAKLRAYATSSTTNGPAVHPSANTWTERGITWNTRPPVGTPVHDVGAVASGTWVEWDVTSLVTGAGTYSFALIGSSTDGLNMSSREGASAPQLVVTAAAGGPAPDTTPPTPPGAFVATAATATSIALDWAPSSDNVGVAGYNLYRDGTKVPTGSETAASVTGLVCDTSYRFAVEALDAAGNVSAQTRLTAATASCDVPPEGPVTCAKAASPVGSDSASGTLSSPFRTPQKLASSLASGQTGCLRGGTYTASSGYVLDASKGGYRLRSYPGERARLIGTIQIKNSAAGVTLSDLDVEGTGGSNTVKVYAPDVVLERNNITNLGRGNSCLIMGSNSGGGQAARPVVRNNRFYACGSAANGNKDHGIYAQNVVDGEIVGNLFWNSAAYAIQLYPNAQRTRFAHNVVDGDSPSTRGGVVFGGSSDYASSNNVVEQNVIAFAETYNITSNWSGPVGSGNVARNNCVWAGTMGNVNTSKGGFSAYTNTVADPLFVDRGDRDYRLLTASPCLAVVGFDPVTALAP